LKEIRISLHAFQSCEKRGVSTEEVQIAIEKGTREPVKQGRVMCRLNFEYNSVWEGKFYSIKQVAPIIVEESNEIVVVTVYSYYF
jgi:hypothetical protein